MVNQELIEKLKHLLKKLFQFENNDLDFGIYRIINIKRKEISEFIETDLFKSISQELEKHKNQQISEEVVYNNIINFFSRYYDNGDFISKRRYSKSNKYLIPYNGEEVYLYWATNDQYYIKTAETFKNYSFKIGNWKIKFEIIDEDVEFEKNNIKETQNKYFIFNSIEPLSNNIINIRFGYRGLSSEEEELIKEEVGKKSIKKDYVNIYNLNRIKETVEISSVEELKTKHQKLNGDLTDKTE
ncbi:hypothetical protein LCGC14_1114490, partial [marine sediment metagenome]